MASGFYILLLEEVNKARRSSRWSRGWLTRKCNISYLRLGAHSTLPCPSSSLPIPMESGEITTRKKIRSCKTQPRPPASKYNVLSTRYLVPVQCAVQCLVHHVQGTIPVSRYVCQHSLVHLGDIARYRSQTDQVQKLLFLLLTLTPLHRLRHSTDTPSAWLHPQDSHTIRYCRFCSQNQV